MTFGAEEPGQILSQDARGRVLVSRERRQSLLEEYDRSGMRGSRRVTSQLSTISKSVLLRVSIIGQWPVEI